MYASHQVNSMGEVLAMGTSEVVRVPGWAPRNVDPKLEVVVKRKMVFTDNGGYYGKHTGNQQSTLRFWPSDPNMRVRVKFVTFKTVTSRAALFVYTTGTPSNLELAKTPYQAYLMGDEARLPETFVSEAGDGTLTLQFVSREGYDEAGWVAEVDEVASSNTLALIAATAQLQGTEASAKVPIRLRILNRWGNDAKGVTVRITDVNGRFITELIN